MNVIYELLEQRSLVDRDQLALVSSKQRLSFFDLKLSVDSVAGKLSNLGVNKGQLVAINLPAFENWIVCLAVAKIGAIGISLAWETPTNLSDSGMWHYLVSSKGNNVTSETTLVFDPSWQDFNHSFSKTPAADLADTDFVRAIATSGTTGKPKLALFDQRSIAQKIDNLTGVWGGAGREFNFMPLAATGGFSTALVSLLTGTPFLAKDTIKRALIDFLIENQVEVLAGSPDQISGFIDANRENLGLLSEIKQIRLAGSHPGPLFLEKVRSFFDVQITSVYGSTETGAIFTVEVDRDSELRAMGMLKPGAQARVVDDTGQPLPMDAEGFLETKSDSMYSGYLADKQDMSIQEPGEWFATSDMAKVTEAGFVFLGRPSAVLNIGGVKIAVDELEQFVKQLDGVDDALSFEAEDKMGQAIHVMAVVASSDEIVESLIEAVNSRFKSRAPKLFWKTEFIDRAGLDKPARWKARERFNSEYLTS